MPTGVPVVSTYCIIVTKRLPLSRTLHTGVAGNNTKFDVKFCGSHDAVCCLRYPACDAV
jgi:hypothetical protein